MCLISFEIKVFEKFSGKHFKNVIKKKSLVLWFPWKLQEKQCRTDLFSDNNWPSGN